MNSKLLRIVSLFLPLFFSVQYSYAYEKLTDGVLFEIKKQKETDPAWLKI